jgi:hypothetical protein
MNDVRWKYVFFGVGAYILAWILWNVISIFIFTSASSAPINEAYALIFQIFNFAVGLVPGYVAGILAKVRPIFHAFLAGSVISALMILYYYIFGVFQKSTLSSILFIPIFLMILSSLGGVVANWQLNRKETSEL